MKKKPQDDRTICRNRKAHFQFEIIERLECGIVLVGTEVKSLRDGNASINEAFARIEGDELVLIGFHIASYKHGSTNSHDPDRRRRLLVHKRQLAKLKPALTQKGLTLVPLRAYFNERGIAKVELALARGKTHGDKRQDIRKRDAKREIDRMTRRTR